MAAPTKLPSMPTIGRRHLESRSREKGKLNFTCIWQGKAWQLLCTLLKHVFMLLCAVNWKIQHFPEYCRHFLLFLIILDWHWFPLWNAMIYEKILLYWGCMHHINKTTCILALMTYLWPRAAVAASINVCFLVDIWRDASILRVRAKNRFWVSGRSYTKFKDPQRRPRVHCVLISISWWHNRTQCTRVLIRISWWHSRTQCTRHVFVVFSQIKQF